MSVHQVDKNLAIFLEHFGNVHYVQSQGDLSSRSELHLEPERLKPFINPDKIIERVRKIVNKNDLSVDQMEAAKQFIKEYDYSN